MEDKIFDLLDRLCDEARKSVEYGDWPELQGLVVEAETVLAVDALELLRRLKDEVITSVEYGDWPELQELVDEAGDLLATFA